MPTKNFWITCREVLAIQKELLCNWQPPTASGVGYRFEMVSIFNKKYLGFQKELYKSRHIPVIVSSCTLLIQYWSGDSFRGYCLLKITDAACCKNQDHSPVFSHLNVAW